MFFLVVFCLSNLGLGLSRGDIGSLLGRCLCLSEVGVCPGDLRLSSVLTANCHCFLLFDVNTLVCLRSLPSLLCLRVVLCYLNLSGSVGLCLSDGSIPLCVSDIDPSLLDCSGCGLLTDALDVVGLVCDVGDVNVDQIQSDLPHLLSDVLLNQL